MFSYLDLGGSCVGIDSCKTSLSCTLKTCLHLDKKEKKNQESPKIAVDIPTLS